MAAGAMASFISRVSSFLLAAATLSATNQPLNNQHHHHHHQLQQHQHHTHPHLHHHHNHHNTAHNHHQHQHQHSHPNPNPNPHTHPHTHQHQPQPQRQPQPQAQHQHQIKFQQHQQPTARHHFLQGAFPLSHSPLLTPQQLTNRQATVSFADLASSSTSRASNTIPGGGTGGSITFPGGGASSFVNPSSSSSQAAQSQPQHLPASQVASPASSSSSSLSPSPSSSSTSSSSSSTTSASSSAKSSSAAAVAVAPSASQTVGGLPSLSSSSMYDVFEYVMHYKPSTPLISPSSLTFSTIPINFNNKHQRQHYQAASSILQPISQPPLSQQLPSSQQQQQQQQQQNRKHHQQTFSQQVPLQQQQQQQQQQQPQPLVQQQQQHQQQQQLLQKQTTNNGSSSSLLEISRSSNSSIGRGILSRFSLLQSNNHQQQQQQQQRREDVCGRTMQTPQRRIIGGEGARYGEFPYQVHIKIAKHQCGGALIDKQSIVTAAHCVYHFMTRAPVSKLQIVIGAYDIEDEQYQELPPQYFKVNKVKLHPQFRFSASHPDRYDIAILKLDKPVKYTDNVLPVCLPSRDLKFESMIGTVTGFGKTDPSLSNRYGTRLLQKVDVPIIENNECERWHRTRGIDLKIFPEMMCAGYEDGLKDACVGDSGGPLVVKTSLGPNGSFRWTLAGITSAGFGCAQSRQPGIYHRVSHTVDWILDNLD